MPAVSLVVCVHRERELLQRLLRESAGLYDDLIVIHDGPDDTGVRAVVDAAGGRFFERPRAYQQEPHWPFAWQNAAHDWILRLDADEFPSPELKAWLNQFRARPGPEVDTSGFTCIWPLWNGRRAISKVWPAGRIFLFHRQRVRFFGMVEQVPIADTQFEPLALVLRHEPPRKSYGFRNLVLRRQAYYWRECIAESLLREPALLACWRWGQEPWPPVWEEIRRHPLRTSLSRLVREPFRALRAQWRTERRFFLAAAFAAPIHHALVGLKLWRLRKAGLRRVPGYSS
jgi:hypothetical protein